jgi:imidazolonepropionase-like amidohydrolase
VEHGMRPEQAIQAATLNSAELLGLASEIGSLETGKTADFIAVRGNPLENVRVLEQIDYVIQGGDVVHSPDRPLRVMAR